MTAVLPDRDPAVFERLLRSSAKQSYDPDVDIDWDAPLVEGKWGMMPERMSLYGTELWDSLTLEQQMTLSNHEAGSMVSVGVWFELMLMQVILRDLYDDDIQSAHMHYALTEVADECRHSTMFGKTTTKLGVPAYGPAPKIHAAGRLYAKHVKGPAAFAGILVVEEIIDMWQREMLTDERVQPLIRQVSRIHVLEEARHMTFAREEVRDGMPGLSRRELAMQRKMVAHVVSLVTKALINNKAYASVGIDPKVGLATARSNPNYQATLQGWGRKSVEFMREVGLMSKRSEKTWRDALLIP
ncbi:MAG TPA: diiron oxygenase [Marmoricola sp.]|nr:diiron oxygenase [Marmoricola sp.]HNN48103.1 diiron oxygenase [Marmoricola sp.]HNO38809.1 diiron oxygenase [Marmoricola sp.]